MKEKSKNSGVLPPIGLRTIVILLGVAISSMSLLGTPVSEHQRSKTTGASIDGDSERQLTSLAFPKFQQTSDREEILENYPAYVRFAVEVGRHTDADTAKRLDHTYQTLRTKYPEGAARFLKGLRFEMVQKLEFAGLSADATTTDSPVMRKWVAKYLRIWLREADEHLFRSYAQRLAKKE